MTPQLGIHVPVEQWAATVTSRARLAAPKTRRVRTLDALGSRLASPLVAAVPAPEFPMSAMDGFAVNSTEIRALIEGAADARPAVIDVSMDIAAGAATVGRYRPQTAARIMTGARVPDGLDVVLPVELTDADPVAPEAPRTITLDPQAVADLERVLAPGRHVRPVGEEIRAGEVLAPAGAAVTSHMIGVALAAGITEVEIEAPRRVAIIMTGDELVTELRDGAGPAQGAVLESNGPTLAAALTELGCEATIHHVADSTQDLVGLVRSIAPRHDLVITTGGVGSGARDVVKAAFSQVPGGLACSEFAHVHMRPGGPQGVGRLGGEYHESIPMVHLPGTPVGALVGFHLFVRPLLDVAGQGLARMDLPAVHVHLTEREEAGRGKAASSGRSYGGVSIVPVTLTVVDGAVHARQSEGSRLRPFAQANALALLPPALPGTPADPGIPCASGASDAPAASGIADRVAVITLR